MRLKDGLLKLAWWVLRPAIAIYAWLEFLAPIKDYQKVHHAHPSALMVELLRPNSDIYKFYGENYIFLLVSAALVVITFSYIQRFISYFDTPRPTISIVGSSITLKIDEPSGKTALATRDQIFYANNSGILAYNINYNADSYGGMVVRKGIELSSEVDGKVITEDLLKRGSDKNLEVREIYKNELPHNFFLTYCPDDLVEILNNIGLLKSIMVKRTGSATYLDEYSSNNCSISQTSSRYPSSNISVIVDFCEEYAKRVKNPRGFIIKEMAVKKIELIRRELSGRVLYEAREKRLDRASLEIQWELE